MRLTAVANTILIAVPLAMACSGGGVTLPDLAGLGGALPGSMGGAPGVVGNNFVSGTGQIPVSGSSSTATGGNSNLVQSSGGVVSSSGGVGQSSGGRLQQGSGGMQQGLSVFFLRPVKNIVDIATFNQLPMLHHQRPI